MPRFDGCSPRRRVGPRTRSRGARRTLVALAPSLDDPSRRLLRPSLVEGATQLGDARLGGAVFGLEALHLRRQTPHRRAAAFANERACQVVRRHDAKRLEFFGTCITPSTLLKYYYSSIIVVL